MRLLTDEDLEPIGPRGNRHPYPPTPTEYAAGVALKAVGLVVLILMVFEAGAASEAELAADAFGREYDAQLRTEWAGELLARYVHVGEASLAECLAVRKEIQERTPPRPSRGRRSALTPPPR